MFVSNCMVCCDIISILQNESDTVTASQGTYYCMSHNSSMSDMSLVVVLELHAASGSLSGTRESFFSQVPVVSFFIPNSVGSRKEGVSRSA